MYRGLLWVAWAVEECSRAFTRLSSRMGKLESRVDLLESEPSRSAVDPKPWPATPAAPPPSAPSAPPAIALDKHTADRIDALEARLKQLDFFPMKLSNLQRTVGELEKALHAEAEAVAQEPPQAAPAPAAAEDVNGADFEAVYQELDRVAEFVAARVESLEQTMLEVGRNASANGHDDSERRLRELEARMQRFERMYAAMQAGLQLVTS